MREVSWLERCPYSSGGWIHIHIVLGPGEVSWLERCPYSSGGWIHIHIVLGPGEVSWLERCPYSSGGWIHIHIVLGPGEVSWLERCPYSSGGWRDLPVETLAYSRCICIHTLVICNLIKLNFLKLGYSPRPGCLGNSTPPSSGDKNNVSWPIEETDNL